VAIAQILPLLKLGQIHPDLMRLAWQVRRSGKTFLDFHCLYSLAANYKTVYARGHHKPQIAEFGVARGGSAMIMAWLVNRYGGSICLFDLFGHIPAPSQQDGERAQERFQETLNRLDPKYYGNIPDLMEIVRTDIGTICPLERIEFIPGRYEETLPDSNDVWIFDLVHVDCDWYESVRTVLVYLSNRMQPGAIMQIDDYSYWQGARKATDEAAWLRPYSWTAVDHALVVDLGKRRL
jgi:hypothetical protein